MLFFAKLIPLVTSLMAAGVAVVRVAEQQWAWAALDGLVAAVTFLTFLLVCRLAHNVRPVNR